MPFIRESVIVTLNALGEPHVAPLGIIEDGQDLIIAPFRPSRTLDNLVRTRVATINYLTDARVFAGLVSGRCVDWPLVRTRDCYRLEAALSHEEIEIYDIVADETRPRFYCRSRMVFTHRPFMGMNRAEAAVLEAAILCTRLKMLPKDKVKAEMAYLEIAIGKTAGPAEREAWGWLVEMIADAGATA
ncbi:hypothetical protein SAMN07250955_11862 [Arboricoccus pini]|uniref:Tetrahydromethanopterin synthesis protein n=1 Tax=Arboricoccus pini TaxID=1963835 RepID=A0A212RZQ2_9PROT|nr:DUF447 domain-containing protein [Arboricoccus pini]SNB78387.1 hypothetical protein SAMN07250955_11862 [Arboricoccus pini]